MKSAAAEDAEIGAARGGWRLLRGRGWALSLGVSLLLLLAWGGYARFFNPDEGRYASASLEMAQGLGGSSPDWVVPHLNGVPRLNKPPLVYWCSALAFRLLGPSEAAGRLPSMLAGAGVALLLLAWGRRAVDETTGRLAALLWLSAAFPFVFARVANTDMLLAASIALATFGVWLAVDGGKREQASAIPSAPAARDVWRGALIAGLGMGLALLAKGPVGVLFPLATGFVGLLATRRWQVLGSARVWAALLVALLIAVAMVGPWAWALSQREPGALSRFLFEENLGRFSGGATGGGKRFHEAEPFWFYAPVVLLGLVPWSAFLFAPSRARGERERRARWFWGVWAALIVGLFSLSSTKLVSYVLPAFAPLSLLLASFFAARIRREEGHSKSEPGRDKSGEPSGEEDTDTPLDTPFDTAADARGAGLWRVALWLTLVMHLALLGGGAYSLLCDKYLPRSEGLPVLALLAVGPVVVVLALARALKDRSRSGAGRAGPVFGWVWAGSALVHAGLLFGVSRVALYEDSGAMMRELSRYLRPGDRVVLARAFQPAAIFYSRRPVSVVDFNNTAGLDKEALQSSKYFVASRPGLFAAWKRDPARTFVLCRWDSAFLPQLRQSGWSLIGSNNGHRLFCSRAAPPGFAFDRVAPRKRGR